MMTRLLFVLGLATVAALASPRSAGARFYSRVGVIVGAPCAAPVFPVYAPPVYYPPFYGAPVVAYPPAYYPAYYPRPYYGYYYRPDDYGRRVVGYTFPGRR
jgi:hypothetical protein